MYKIGDIFWGCLNFKYFLGCLKFLIYFFKGGGGGGGERSMLGPNLRMKKKKEYPPPLPLGNEPPALYMEAEKKSSNPFSACIV